MQKLTLFISFLFFTSMIAFGQSDNNLATQLRIKNGLIEGNFDTKTGIQKYFGIPFAKPPVGNLRFKAPQPASSWSGVLETKEFRARPVQKTVFGDMNSRSAGLSEDCLYLNVWSPAGRSLKNLPVLVYFYGGGNAAGDASEPRYDGEAMAQKGIVVVTCNYRLNIFGFLAHPELTAETSYKGSGNYGALDQVAALKWVQENIATFGGDPAKVTIAGESAGSIGVSTQMASPLAKNLIAGAIGESGAAINPTMAPVPLSDAEKMGVEFLRMAGIKNIAELREMSTLEVYQAFDESKMFGFPLVIDGYFLPKTLPEIFNAKEQAMVPLLAGWNSAEVPAGAFMQGSPMTNDAFVAKVNQSYPKISAEILAAYPHANATEIEWSATNLASDRFISYSTWKWLDLQLNNSVQPVYRYLYSKKRPPLADKTLVSGLAGGTLKADGNAPKAPEALGAPHACEIEYAMGNLNRVTDYAWTAEDFKVSETMLNYFANFIKVGNPNGANLPLWDAMKKGDDTPTFMNINTVSKQEESMIERRYHLHDEYYGN